MLDQLRNPTGPKYLKGRKFRGKKISRISRFSPKSVKLGSREIFRNRRMYKYDPSISSLLGSMYNRALCN